MTDECGHCTTVESSREWWLLFLMFVAIQVAVIGLGWILRPPNTDPAGYYMLGVVHAITACLAAELVEKKYVERREQ